MQWWLKLFCDQSFSCLLVLVPFWATGHQTSLFSHRFQSNLSKRMLLHLRLDCGLGHSYKEKTLCVGSKVRAKKRTFPM